MKRRRSQIADEIVAEMIRKKEYEEWLQRQKEEKEGKENEQITN